MLVKIMYLLIIVSNQDKALEFYSKLGFEKRIDYPGSEGRFLTMGLKGQDVEIILWKGDPTSFKGNPDVPVNVQPGTLFIESKDLKKDYETLLEKGVKFIEKAPEEYAWGVRITALDPDGNRIALRQRK